MKSEKAKHILTAPENEPYPEKLKNLLTIEEAADRWNVPAVTIRAKCKAGFFGRYARKMGGQWILTPEAMYRWRGPAPKNGRYYAQTIESWTNTVEAWNTLEEYFFNENAHHPKEIQRATIILDNAIENLLPNQEKQQYE